MRGFHNNSFDPQTLVVLEAAFDEAWLTLKAIGNTTVKPDELARSVLALAMEGERDRSRAAAIVRRRHLDFRRHRLCAASPRTMSMQTGAAGDRHFRRRFQQFRPSGDPGARRSGP